jgi:hypothetical protein
MVSFFIIANIDDLCGSPLEDLCPWSSPSLDAFLLLCLFGPGGGVKTEFSIQFFVFFNILLQKMCTIDASIR